MKISKRRIVYFLLTAFTFIYFSFFIPIGLVNKAPFGFAVLAAVLFTFFALQTIVEFKSWAEFFNRPAKRMNWRHKIMFLSIIPIIIMVFVFHFLFLETEKRELIKHGELATGTIIDGYSMESHHRAQSGSMYELMLKFKTKQGDTISVIEDVSETEFKHVDKGNKVELIYSEREPSIIQLLLDKNIAKNFPFKGIEQRDIEVKDLQNLVGLPIKPLGLALNRINYKWRFEATDSIWLNEVFDLSLTSNYQDSIALTSFDLSPEGQDPEKLAIQLDKYVEQMEPLQLSPVSSNEKVQLYGNVHFYVSLENVEKPFSNAGYLIGQKITLVKKKQ